MSLKAVLETVLYYRGGEEARMTVFYRDVLGLEQVSDVAFRLDDSLVLLFELEQSAVQSWPPPHGAEGPGHACFLCRPEEYDAWKTRLEALDVRIIDEITWNEHVVSFYFNDPAGNVLEISQGDMWPLGGRSGPSSTEAGHIPIAETISYLRRVLPGPPARVLDVGCGRGELLPKLGAEGYAALGIDTDGESVARAEALGGRAVEADFLSFDDGPFDVVFFGSSLHHLFPLSAALDRAQELLAPGGLLVAEEMAVESVDIATARWLYDLDSVVRAGGLLRGNGHDRADIADPLERWRIEHVHDPPLTTGEDMVAGISEAFDVRLVQRAPYLYRSYCERLGGGRGSAVGLRFFELESAGIAERRLVAVGLRVVASSL